MLLMMAASVNTGSRLPWGETHLQYNYELNTFSKLCVLDNFNHTYSIYPIHIYRALCITPGSAGGSASHQSSRFYGKSVPYETPDDEDGNQEIILFHLQIHNLTFSHCLLTCKVPSLARFKKCKVH